MRWWIVRAVIEGQGGTGAERDAAERREGARADGQRETDSCRVQTVSQTRATWDAVRAGSGCMLLHGVLVLVLAAYSTREDESWSRG